MLEYFMTIWSLMPLLIFDGHLVYVVCGHFGIFSRFGMFGPRKIWQPCRFGIFRPGLIWQPCRFGIF
jgi:hypothetical protein